MTLRLAAIDLGSNSFRLQIAEVRANKVYPLRTEKEMVRLSAGLQPDGTLSHVIRDAALNALTRFGFYLRGMPENCVYSVATHAFRMLRTQPDFIAQAEQALGYPIHIISGEEEAHLLFSGAAHSLPPSSHTRFFVDIGGGSTELILGVGFTVQKVCSVPIGCVAYTQQYFKEISPAAFAMAEAAAAEVFAPLASRFAAPYWQEAIGTSGTARSLCDILQANGWMDNTTLERSALHKLKNKILEYSQLNQVSLLGLRADRQPVITGGLAIMCAIFDVFGIETMQVTLGGLRDGVLQALLETHRLFPLHA